MRHLVKHLELRTALGVLRSKPLAPIFLSLLTLASCVGVIGDREQGNTYSSTGAIFAPAESTLHRLTRPQLRNAWLDLLGEPLVAPADLPADDVLYNFSSIAAARGTISPVDAEKYENATYAVLDQVFASAARRDALVGCSAGVVDDPCVRQFIATFTARAWRRPVADAEIDALHTLAKTIAVQLNDGTQGIKYMLAAVLQSPHFLFRVDIGEMGPDNYRYSSWEMASRLSFLLLDAPPDEALRTAAAKDDLTNPEAVRAHATRLLEDPRARTTLVRFFRDFMNLAKLDSLDKLPEKFPQITATLGPSMRVQMERMFEENVFERQGDFRDLFTTRDTYMNEDLARVYGIDGVTGLEWAPVTLPDDGRRPGILTTPGFLALNSHKSQTSPTHRGRFIRVNLFCQDIPPPPPGINTTLPEPDPNTPSTLRQRLDEHRTNPQCAGCHDRMDPIGFAFESYDAIGAYREVDETGLAIDTKSSVDGHDLTGAADMAALVASLPNVGACIARRFYEHAGAHLAGSSDEAAVETLVDDFMGNDYSFKQLVLALVTNEGYRLASPPSMESTKEVQP
ncbi:MAG TPA: DUF1592 domain-containing protein [Polyangium sp.]|nr:DUF1592 domain-containing protein [Polyangium sp.]